MEGTPPWRKKSRPAQTIVNMNYSNCALSVCVWNEKTSVLVDCLVLGHSVAKQKTKPARVACCSPNILNSNIFKLLLAFWDIAPLRSDYIQGHWGPTDKVKVRGMYAKIDAWRLFSHRGWCQFDRVMMMNGAMLLRANIDDLFSADAPAAVMKSSQNPDYFQRAPEEAKLLSELHRPSIHFQCRDELSGGLFLFSPCVIYHEYQLMAFRTMYPGVPEDLEEDFISDFWGHPKRMKVWGLHEMYSYRIPHFP